MKGIDAHALARTAYRKRYKSLPEDRLGQHICLSDGETTVITSITGWTPIIHQNELYDAGFTLNQKYMWLHIGKQGGLFRVQHLSQLAYEHPVIVLSDALLLGTSKDIHFTCSDCSNGTMVIPETTKPILEVLGIDNPQKLIETPFKFTSGKQSFKDFFKQYGVVVFSGIIRSVSLDKELALYTDAKIYYTGNAPKEEVGVLSCVAAITFNGKSWTAQIRVRNDAKRIIFLAPTPGKVEFLNAL